MDATFETATRVDNSNKSPDTGLLLDLKLSHARLFLLTEEQSPLLITLTATDNLCLPTIHNVLEI